METINTDNSEVLLCTGKECKLKLSCELYLTFKKLWKNTGEFKVFDGDFDRELEECQYYSRSEETIYQD